MLSGENAVHTEESPELNLTSRISAALPGGVTLIFATIVPVCPAAMFRGSGVKVMVAAGAIGVVVILTASLALPPGPVQVRDKRSFLYARKAGCATTCCEPLVALAPHHAVANGGWYEPYE